MVKIIFSKVEQLLELLHLETLNAFKKQRKMFSLSPPHNPGNCFPTFYLGSFGDLSFLEDA